MSTSSYEQLIHRPTYIEVDLEALKHNLSVVQSLVGPAKVMASVKANAYGHGLIDCSRALEKAGADYLGVAFVEEGIQLRKAGVKLPILIFGGLANEQIDTMLKADLDITASSVDKIKAIDQHAEKIGKRARIHLKIDTGMERIGVHYYSAEKLFAAALECKNCDLLGVYSHFATADSKDQSFARQQLDRFKNCLQWFEKQSIKVPLIHMANSGAVQQLPESYFDMVRPGLMLFGAVAESHLAGHLDLKPVLSLKSKVVYFKVIEAGSTVSYGRTWTAPERTRLVTVPVGYGDGYSRMHSNVSSVLIRGKRYPIVGTVCMDQLMVNIGSGEAYNGDEVVLIGQQSEECIKVEELSQNTRTIPYEVFTNMNLRIPRVYLNE